MLHLYSKMALEKLEDSLLSFAKMKIKEAEEKST
jgi:hypothetical protein